MKDAMLGQSIYRYVCSQWEYPSADEVDNDEIPYQVDAVYDTLDAALDYQMLMIQTQCAPHSTEVQTRDSVTCFWDPINNELRMRHSNCSIRFLITRVEMM